MKCQISSFIKLEMIMSRPKNKSDLLELGQSNFDKLIDYINDLPEEKQHQVFPEEYLNRNIRDVLAHLYEWHLMVHSWHKVGLTGLKPDIPAKGYTWKTTPELNCEIQKKHSTMSLAEAQKKLAAAHKKTRNIITSHTNEELFEKKRYKWTGTTSMGAYFVSCTSSHYDWALKLIKKCLK